MKKTAALMICAVFIGGCAQSLHDTVARGDIDAVRKMLDTSPDLVHDTNNLGKTPLHYAVTYKQKEIMALLLERGADINAADRTGMTPLHAAAMLGRGEEAMWLIGKGAEIEAVDKFGDTPIHTAAIFGHGHIIRLLHEHGARLDLKNRDGRTPLDLAQIHHQDRLAQYIRQMRG